MRPSTSQRVPNWNYWLSIALAAAVVVGISVAWSPQFWPAAVLYALILFTAMASLVLIRTWNFPLSALLLLVISSWGWLQLTLLGSTVGSFTRIKALGWSVAGIAFALALQVFRSHKARNSFLSVIVWAGAAFSVLAVLQLYSSPDWVFWIFPAEQFTVGTFLYKNQFAAMIELAIPISLYWIFFEPAQRFAGIFTFIALFGGVIVSNSRAGVSLVLLECLAATLLAYRAGKIRLAFAAAIAPTAAIALVAIALLFGNEAAWSHYQEIHLDTIRQKLLKSTIQMIQHEPWSGYGLGTWSVIYPQYATFDVGRFANAAHNDWAEWTAEGGFLFSGCIFVFFASLIKPAIKSVWGLGVIAIMLHSWVDYPTREPVLCILWFCLAGALATSSSPRNGYRRFTRNSPESTSS